MAVEVPTGLGATPHRQGRDDAALPPVVRRRHRGPGTSPTRAIAAGGPREGIGPNAMRARPRPGARAPSSEEMYK
jgi:hypothetical protein